MAQSGYPGPAVMVEARHITLPHYATPPEQAPFLSPTNDYHLSQQWPGWDYRSFGTEFSPGNSTGSMSSVQWDGERQGQPPFEEARTMSEYPATTWAPQPDNWSSYQQPQQHNLQPPQSAVFSAPHQWPTPACSPLTMVPGWQPPPDGRNQGEAKPRASATKKRTNKTVRKATDPSLPSTAQHHPKKARSGAGSEPSPTSSMSYDDNGEWGEDDNEGGDIDTYPTPPGPDRKKTYRVKNRAAAKRCREKTKQYEIDLAAKEKQVTQERMYLDACVTALKNEVLTLKNQILQHGDCDCDMIQGYIARTANSVSVSGHGVPTRPRPSA